VIILDQKQKQDIGLAKHGDIMAKKGLYANIHAKRKRIKEGSGEKMRKKGAKGAPAKGTFKAIAKKQKQKKKKVKKNGK
tara:strand:+ start:66 stop:302 length:237 start_codon:yes stop_codon:yes gene_type:complete